MLSDEQKQRMMASNDSGRGVPNNVSNNLSNEVQTSSAPSTFSQAMNFTQGVSPAVQQSLNELSMETDETTRGRLRALVPKQYAKGGMIKRAGHMNFKQFQMALGGSANDLVTKGGQNDLIEFEGGGTHEQNPLGGIPIGMNNQGQMNSVEAGESKYSFKDGDYVFSDRIKL